jgi:hypothetical protein
MKSVLAGESVMTNPQPLPHVEPKGNSSAIFVKNIKKIAFEAHSSYESIKSCVWAK